MGTVRRKTDVISKMIELKTMVQVEVNEDQPCLLAKTKPLVTIINEIQPNNEWQTDYFHAPYSEKDMLLTLIKSQQYLEEYQKEYVTRCYQKKRIISYDTHDMMGRQFLMACKTLMHIESGHYKDAYYRLWCCIDGHGIKNTDLYINLNDYLIYRSLISCFIQSLLKQEKEIKKKLSERIGL
jgi:hypothetical protein